MAEIVNLKRVSPSADAHLAAIVDSSYDAIVSKDLNSVITSWNAAAARLFGYTAAEAIGCSVLMLIPEGLKGEETDIIARVRRGERVASYETVRQRKDGTLVEVSLTISPIRGSDGEIIGASKIARDISSAKESERRIKLLMREVNHRVKNQFAVILSMIRETGRWSTDPRDFEARVRDRIMALSRSHDLLVTSEWSGASLVELIQEHLKPFGHERQVSLSGPLLELHPNTVQHFGMALHELGTNSAKYGALSGSAGRVNISWQIAKNVSGEQEFSFTWEETSIPREVPAETEARKGFGTVVLQRVAPQAMGGSAVLDRVPGHTRWTLVAPATNIIGRGDKLDMPGEK
jgi:PAS domain S-box-containing protein